MEDEEGIWSERETVRGRITYEHVIISSHMVTKNIVLKMGEYHRFLRIFQ